MTTSGIRAAVGGRASSVYSVARLFAVLIAAMLVSGCAVTNSHISSNGAPTPGSSTKILLMTPDVELSVLTAGGLLEPNAEWTETAKGHVNAALSEILSSKSATIVPYKPHTDLGPGGLAEVQVLKLHETVGASILAHKYSPFPLPTKENRFDWGLGESVTVLGEKYDADYVLFVHMRDSFSSGGRVALQVFAAIAGVGVQGGHQSAYMSLVDLNTGDVVWFNRLVSTVGDLRTAEGTMAATRDLLDESPL